MPTELPQQFDNAVDVNIRIKVGILEHLVEKANTSKALSYEIDLMCIKKDTLSRGGLA